MQGDDKHAGNVILLQFACLWILAALVLAWCLVGLGFDLAPLHALFPGKYQRVVQAHLDLLIMSALILGFYGARAPLPWHVRWAMGVGAFTNSSLFLLMALFPGLDPATPAPGPFATLYLGYTLFSLTLTSYGFGKGAVTVLKWTLR
ncbi:hypothetical protein [Methylocystis bryophila]|uniref:Uncharacterized protein n=1 Tax=Methylocystis bryophila TaxID=655015 RepID=A0A1W6MTG3_9HYPH|nr:hypothetical protein [Methylocystis bryophila]ARN80855.1 hypothetical protein B1812_06925 [Methylocystis bryophila]BDV40941.1 hypothetical protein DSM21852_41940 [Methylocystis bryophila]